MTLMRVIRVDQFHIAGSKNLEAVVEVGSWGEVLDPEAGAGIVDFDEFNSLSGVVAYRRDDVGRVATCQSAQTSDRDESERPTHES